MSTESLTRAVPDPSAPQRLPPVVTASAMEAEFAVYLRELPRLLAEGHVGRYALIKGNDIISVWDTQRDVLQAGYDRFGLDEPFSIQEIDPRDPARVAAILAAKGVACRS